MKIKAIIVVFKSKRDRNGNTYWAFRAINPINGQIAAGLLDHSSNLEAAIYTLVNVDYFWTVKELGKRAFKDECGSWKYAGCKPEEIAKFISDRAGIFPPPKHDYAGPQDREIQNVVAKLAKLVEHPLPTVGYDEMLETLTRELVEAQNPNHTMALIPKAK